MLPTHREPTSPGKMLQFMLDEMGLTQVQLAEHLGWSTVKVNQIVRDKRGITPETALALGDAFGDGPEIWLNIQTGWQLWHALQSHQPKPRLVG
jgi:addiction module HigA family antidote